MLLELGKIVYVKISGEAVMPLRWYEKLGEYDCRRHLVTKDRNEYTTQSFLECELETKEDHEKHLNEDREGLAKMLRKHGVLIGGDELAATPPTNGLPS